MRTIIIINFSVSARAYVCVYIKITHFFKLEPDDFQVEGHTLLHVRLQGAVKSMPIAANSCIATALSLRPSTFVAAV